MAWLVAFLTLLINIVLILVAAWIGYENVPHILNGTATFWNYVWTVVALVFVVSAGTLAQSSKK